MADSSISDVMLREVALTREEYDTIVARLGRPPNLVELGMFGAMWSEHCGYKNSKPLLRRLPTTGPRVLQGPGENAGVVDLGNGEAVAFKVESHNHPSAGVPLPGSAPTATPWASRRSAARRSSTAPMPTTASSTRCASGSCRQSV